VASCTGTAGAALRPACSAFPGLVFRHAKVPPATAIAAKISMPHVNTLDLAIFSPKNKSIAVFNNVDADAANHRRQLNFNLICAEDL
jgi:hypothetical protein